MLRYAPGAWHAVYHMPAIACLLLQVCLGYEVARLALGALLVRCHKRENLATP